jgi:hypothetical protein
MNNHCINFKLFSVLFSNLTGYIQIYNQEATKPDNKGLKINDEKECPSDESEDEDYNPELNEVTCCNGSQTEEMDSDGLDLSNSTTYYSISDKFNFGEAGDGEKMNRPRQRTNVDYKKLHDVGLMDSNILLFLHV